MYVQTYSKKLSRSLLECWGEKTFLNIKAVRLFKSN